MTPVHPFLIRKNQDGCGGELVLRLRHGKSAYIVQLSMEQARLLAVEMRGLSTDHCPQHHLALQVARVLEGRICGVVLTLQSPAGEVRASMRMDTPDGLRCADVDPAAALAMAMHIGLPIFMEGEFVAEGEIPQLKENSRDESELTPIPNAFLEWMERMEDPSLE